jgi:ABC-type lipoprotein export system ATPase subunit
MNIKSITVIGGHDKTGAKENIEELTISAGEIVGIVGPTGSGKSSIISDIEQIAQGDTFSGRRVLFDGKVPSRRVRSDPRKKLVAQLSQTMNFLADMTVHDFILLHSKCRGIRANRVKKVIDLANSLTGEPINRDHKLTILSGGQTRSLMVADIALISNSPVVLIDEIENAGIKKKEAIDALTGNGKLVLIVTHDPVLALMASKRIVMKNGGMNKLIMTNQEDLEYTESWASSTISCWTCARSFAAARSSAICSWRKSPYENSDRCRHARLGQDGGTFTYAQGIAAVQKGLQHCQVRLSVHGRRRAVQAAGPARHGGAGQGHVPRPFRHLHYEEIFKWASDQKSDILVVETAGLCHRCAPYTENSLGICVLDATTGPNTPLKLGPFLSTADIAVITKGDLISQAEREIYRERILEINPDCTIIEANGLSGKGSTRAGRRDR